jgi:hypothetical protein
MVSKKNVEVGPKNAYFDKTPVVMQNNRGDEGVSTIVIPMGKLIEDDNSATYLRVVKTFNDPDQRPQNSQVRVQTNEDVYKKNNFFR